MPKVLFLGCNASQVPYLEAARGLGFTVIGTDRNPEAPGAARADRFHPVGYRDLEGLRRVADAEALGPDDRVFTAAAHLAYEAASVVAAERGIAFPSPRAIATCLDKTRFYAAARAAGLTVPPTRELGPGETPALEPGRAYWLKSDYGKSPRYCWRIAGGAWPERPAAFDDFYRRAFLLQEEVEGVHHRVNLWGDQAAVFERGRADAWRTRRDLGPGHAPVVARLRRLAAGLGVDGWLTKWDLIESEGVFHVLDLGLDPPTRLRLLCTHRGVDFATAYACLYLRGDARALPPWSWLARPAEISGDAATGYRVASAPAPVP